MKDKISLKYLLLIPFLAIITTLVVFYYLGYLRPIQSTKNIGLTEDSDIGLPTQIIIPQIKVDALIVYVGITKDGAMGAPVGPKEAGWFDLGPKPGEVGSAVIDGHFGYKNNIPAVFDDLDKLKKGDRIYVKDNKGKTNVFIVRESREYKPTADATNVFSSSDGLSHLNLVTCSGVWNAVDKSHSKRLVVFSDRE